MSNSTNSLPLPDFLLRAIAPPLNSTKDKNESAEQRSEPLLRCFATSADQREIAGRFLAAIAHDLVLDLLTLIEPRQPGALDRRDVDEDVLAAGIRLNEAVALLRVEPLDRTRSHSGLHEIRKARHARRVSPCSCRPHGLEEHAGQA